MKRLRFDSLSEREHIRCYSARFADLLFVGRGVGIEVGPVGFCVVGIALPDFPITAAGGGVGA